MSLSTAASDRSFSPGRRSILKAAGALSILSCCPLKGWLWAQAGSPAPTGSVMDILSRYMAAAAEHPLPPDVEEQAKFHVLDTFAAMISGSRLPPGRAATRFLAANQSGGDATVVASRLLCDPLEAALVNGILAHSDESDDSNAPSQSHPGCSIVSASLASGEHFDISGQRFLRAVALGYDIGPRMTIALGGAKFQDDSHRSTHSIAGTFGSAAAAGCTAGLSAQQMRWLLDYAAQQASGTAAWQRDTQHVEKASVFAGFPARNGVTAALLVSSGASGVDDILSGSDNFFLAFQPDANPAALIDRLGQRYEVARTNIKKWTVGSPIQATLDALESLITKNHLDVSRVQKVVVRVATREASVVNDREMPDICLQHMAAVMLVDKTVSFASAHDIARMRDPAVLRERAKITLVADEELQKRMPHREAIVEITLNDGSQLSEHVRAVRGTAEDPMSREEVIAKASDLIGPVAGGHASTQLIHQVLSLESLKSIRSLRPLLQAGA